MKLDLTSERGIYRKNYNVLKSWYNLNFLGQVEKTSFRYIYINYVLPLREENHI